MIIMERPGDIVCVVSITVRACRTQVKNETSMNCQKQEFKSETSSMEMINDVFLGLDLPSVGDSSLSELSSYSTLYL